MSENQYDLIGNSVINQYGTVKFECENRKEAELAAGLMNALLAEIERLKTALNEVTPLTEKFSNQNKMNKVKVEAAIAWAKLPNGIMNQEQREICDKVERILNSDLGRHPGTVSAEILVEEVERLRAELEEAKKEPDIYDAVSIFRLQKENDELKKKLGVLTEAFAKISA